MGGSDIQPGQNSVRVLPSRTCVSRLATLKGEKTILLSGFFTDEKAW